LLWPLLARLVADATAAVDDAQGRYEHARAALAELHDAHAEVHRAEISIDAARIRDRLDRLTSPSLERSLDRGVGIDGPGL
jgi:hypothetical protein